MPSLQQAKTLGGVGAILGLLSIVPFAGPVLSIVGLILVLMAVRHIADVAGDRRIFNNMLISVILGIVGLVVGVAFVISAIFRFVGMGFLGGGFINAGPTPFNPGSLPPGDFMAFAGTVITGLVVVWVLFLVSAIFVKKSYDEISRRIGVGMFHTSALLYLIGAALVIVFGIGLILVLVAVILEIVAFFSIPEQMQQPVQAPQMPTAPTMPPPV